MAKKDPARPDHPLNDVPPAYELEDKARHGHNSASLIIGCDPFGPQLMFFQSLDRLSGEEKDPNP